MPSVAEKSTMERPIQTGFPTVDNQVELLPGSLHLVASRPGVGRTTFALNISLQVAMAPHPSTVAYFTFNHESSLLRKQCLKILHATKIRPIASGLLQDFPIGFFHANSLADFRNMLLFSRPRFVVIDSLDGFLAMHKRCGSTRTYGRPAMLRFIRELGKEFGAICMVHANVNRASERRTDCRPRAREVFGGNKVISQADSVFILHRPKCSWESEPLDKQDLEVSIYKSKRAFNNPFRLHLNHSKATWRVSEKP